MSFRFVYLRIVLEFRFRLVVGCGFELLGGADGMVRAECWWRKCKGNLEVLSHWNGHLGVDRTEECLSKDRTGQQSKMLSNNMTKNMFSSKYICNANCIVKANPEFPLKNWRWTTTTDDRRWTMDDRLLSQHIIYAHENVAKQTLYCNNYLFYLNNHIVIVTYSFSHGITGAVSDQHYGRCRHPLHWRWL